MPNFFQTIEQDAEALLKAAAPNVTPEIQQAISAGTDTAITKVIGVLPVDSDYKSLLATLAASTIKHEVSIEISKVLPAVAQADPQQA